MAKAKPIKLKPCPFCGCKVNVTTQTAPAYAGFGTTAHVGCNSRRCEVHPSTGATVYEPNTRKLANSNMFGKSWERRRRREESALEKTKAAAIKAAAKVWNRRSKRGG